MQRSVSPAAGSEARTETFQLCSPKEKNKTKNKPTTLCRDDKTPQCQYNAPRLSPPEKEKGRRGTVSFITAKGKGKAPSFARQKVFLGLRVVAPEASQRDLSIGDIAAAVTDSHQESRPATLKKAPFRELYLFSFFSVCAKHHNWRIPSVKVSLDLKEAS